MSLCALLIASAAGVIACEQPVESTFDPEPPKRDAAPEPEVPNLQPELQQGDGGGGEGGAVKCSPSIPANFVPTWMAPTKSTACSADDLKAYYDACLVNPGTTEADGTCTKWKADHADCGACAEPDTGAGPVQWHSNRKYYTLNVAGCIAIQQDKMEPESCGERYNAAVECTRQSCEACFASGGTFDQFRDCQKSVQGQGICKSFDNAQATACQGYKNPGEPTIACFNSGAESQEAHFLRVIGLVCNAAQAPIEPPPP